MTDLFEIGDWKVKMETDWFEALMGFREESYDDTRSKLRVADGRLLSRVNCRSWDIGEFEMVPLAELRKRASSYRSPHAKPNIALIQGDVRQLHADPAYAGALFQVASQFNALEMTGPDLTPEDGVARYIYDRTQGPACALAAAPATIYRNFFVPIQGGVGQTRSIQIDGLASVGAALSAWLSRPVADLWTMKNGYALCSASGLRSISDWLATATPEQRDEIRGRLSIGLHRGVEVTEAGASPDARVSQAFCSALPVSYSQTPKAEWCAFATLVLEAVYEATLLAAAVQGHSGGSRVVVLTLLGDGAFGNARDWIFSAIRRAIEQVGDLDVRIVSYSDPDPALRKFVAML